MTELIVGIGVAAAAGAVAGVVLGWVYSLVTSSNYNFGESAEVGASFAIGCLLVYVMFIYPFLVIFGVVDLPKL